MPEIDPAAAGSVVSLVAGAIALLELAVVFLFMVSGFYLEFLPGMDRIFLRAALVLALFTFFILGFGLRISGDFQGAANLFAYFGTTLVALMFIERLNTI